MTATLPQPALYVEYWTQNSSTFGPLALDGLITDALRVGWSWYSRYPSKAFFTLRQGSIHAPRLIPLKTHIRILYAHPGIGIAPRVVFSGRLGEPDSTTDDIVWEAYSYAADLSLSRTGYRTLYPTKKIGTELAAIEWGLAKGQVFSLMAHIATGTIEDPLGSDTVTPITTDAAFGVVDVPRLLLMFDLTEIGRANTVNNCVFEITRNTPYTFNFWKNRGTARTAIRLTPPAVIRDYRFSPGYRNLRNDLATIGSSSTGGAVEILATDELNAEEFGRRQDVFSIKTLSGIAGAPTEQDAQRAITERAVKEAVTLARALQLDVRSNLIPPFEGWDLEDTVRVQIKRGRDNIDAEYRIIGVRGMAGPTGYDQQLVVALPTAA